MARLSYGLLLCLAAFAATNPQYLYQQPTLSRTHIAFVYAGDIWTVPRGGGAARRITTGPGSERNPVFSPDRSQIAFTGEYDGNVDVYVVPAGGGVPRRAYSRFSELFTAERDGRFPERLPLPMGHECSYSPDGSRAAYVPLGRAFTSWQRYRGGAATPIWIAMCVGDTIYFLSDRNGAVSLYAYDTRSRQVKQALKNRGLDLKSASPGPGAIVYEQFGGLHLCDMKSGKSHLVKIDELSPIRRTV